MSEMSAFKNFIMIEDETTQFNIIDRHFTTWFSAQQKCMLKDFFVIFDKMKQHTAVCSILPKIDEMNIQNWP